MAGEDVPQRALQATLVLIPKESMPASMRGFLPLSLCNVHTKLVSRILVDRLKEILKTLISPCQTSFVPGRQAIDNAIICQEMIHSMRFTKAKKGAVILKVDLKKAYDRLEWSFIEDTLVDAGMPNKLVDIIMRLVSGGSCKLLWNGEITDEIKISRGLRQGDPLSPYLFVLCMERLGHWVAMKVEEGSLKPVRALRNGPGLSFLFFADDLILFSEVVEEQVMCLIEGRRHFCRASGQRVNYSKSAMFLSPNVAVEKAKSLSNKAGIPLTDYLGRYLGYQLLHGGRNKSAHLELVK